MDILKFVQNYLNDNRGNWPTICEEAGVSYSWLTKIVQSAIKQPGIGELQKLINYIESQGGVIVLKAPKRSPK